MGTNHSGEEIKKEVKNYQTPKAPLCSLPLPILTRLTVVLISVITSLIVQFFLKKYTSNKWIPTV